MVENGYSVRLICAPMEEEARMVPISVCFKARKL